MDNENETSKLLVSPNYTFQLLGQKRLGDAKQLEICVADTVDRGYFFPVFLASTEGERLLQHCRSAENINSVLFTCLCSSIRVSDIIHIIRHGVFQPSLITKFTYEPGRASSPSSTGTASQWGQLWRCIKTHFINLEEVTIKIKNEVAVNEDLWIKEPCSIRTLLKLNLVVPGFVVEPATLGRLGHLKEVSLRTLYMDDDHITTLVKAFPPQSSSLQILEMSIGQLRNPDVCGKAVAEMINCTELFIFRVFVEPHWNIQDAFVLPLLEIMKTNKSIKSLWLPARFDYPKPTLQEALTATMKCNRTLEFFVCAHSCPLIYFYLGLNRAGRKKLQIQQPTCKDWVDIMGASQKIFMGDRKNQLSALFYFLSEHPELINNIIPNEETNEEAKEKKNNRKRKYKL